MNIRSIFILFAAIGLALYANVCNAQGVAINSSGSKADTSALLDLGSTSKGFLPPRMTIAQRNAIVSPQPGLVVYNTDCNDMNYYRPTYGWRSFSGGGIATLGAVTNEAPRSFTINWSAAPGDVTGYNVDVSSDSAFSSFFSGYNNLSVGKALSANVTYSCAPGPIYYRVRASYCAGQSDNSATGVFVHNSWTFAAVGSVQTYTVPCGITRVYVRLGGGGGGRGGEANAIASYGALVTGTLTVTPGAVLTLIVGNKGYDFGGTGGAGGYGGGGNGGDGGYSWYNGVVGQQSAGGGGGRSAIQITAGTDLITAGGGGGSAAGYSGSSYGNGGDGGALDGQFNYGSDGGGHKGTTTGGGTGSTGCDVNGTAGSQYTGGAGANGVGSFYNYGTSYGIDGFGGGGGGGGYYGGGGGGAYNSNYNNGFGGGGGGSSYTSGSGFTGTNTTGGNTTSQDGWITISY
jgi:hypothetical protein